MATNRDLCTYLFDRTRHLTLQNIADLRGTPASHVEAFYLELKEVGLLRMWTTEGYEQKAKANGWSKYIDMWPTVETLEEFLTKAEARGIKLDVELPSQSLRYYAEVAWSEGRSSRSLCTMQSFTNVSGFCGAEHGDYPYSMALVFWRGGGGSSEPFAFKWSQKGYFDDRDQAMRAAGLVVQWLQDRARQLQSFNEDDVDMLVRAASRALGAPLPD